MINKNVDKTSKWMATKKNEETKKISLLIKRKRK